MTDPIRRSVVFLTTADPSAAPHPEWIVWALERAGWDVMVIAPSEDSSIVRRTMSSRWRYRVLPFGAAHGRVRSEFVVFWELLKARFGRHSVIFIHSQGLGWRAALALSGPLFRKRLVYHNPDYYDPIVYPVRTALERLLARKSDLAVSHEYHRGYIQRAQYRLRCPVLVSPPSLPASWPVPPRSENRRSEMAGDAGEPCFILRLHSTFAPARMVPQVFRALAMLPARFRLVMTGEPAGGPSPEARRLLGQLGIEGRVLSLPRLEYPDMLAYTASADAGVLLYSNNDLGNYFQAPGRLTEYLACGLPVLAPRFAGIENLVLRYRIGRCVDPADPASIAEGILALEEDVRSGEASPARIRHRFEQHFAYEHWERRVVEAFENVLGPRVRNGYAPVPEYWFPEGGRGPQ